MRVSLLFLAGLCMVITLVAFWVCSRYDSPGEMLASTAALVAALSLGLGMAFAIGSLFVGAFEQRGKVHALIDELAGDRGLAGAENDPAKLQRIIAGTSYESLGHRCVVDCGAMGASRSADGRGSRLAILMLQYSWQGGERTRSKQMPLVVLVNCVPETIRFSLVDGPFANERLKEEIDRIRVAHAGLDGEVCGGSVFLTLRRSLVNELASGLKHPFSTMTTRLREDYHTMLRALPQVVDTVQREAKPA
jgi:hypothetical protein